LNSGRARAGDLRILPLVSGAFVKEAQFFVKMRDKIRNFLKKMKAKASVRSGFLGAALKAAFKGLQLVFYPGSSRAML
jgi:hypothetical protein